jgi:Predicted nucleic acid-binding protein, contains PIN domain
MLLDTCFLIQLQREFRRGEPGRAVDFLETNAGHEFCISVISVTEFLEGFERIHEGERLLRSYRRIDLNSQIASQAAIYRRELRFSGQLIGDFDILIGATAAVEGLPLVTDNLAHFGRLEGVSLVGY